MNKHTIVPLEEGNIDHLYTLFESVYQKKCAKNYFHLKYNTAYTGVQHIGYFAMDNGKPVAYYGIVPTRVSINNKTILAAQSCDTMTHPEYRKRGLFIELARLSFDLAKEKGIHFIFGFPNESSNSLSIDKLGFYTAETLNRYSFKFGDNLFKKIYRKINRPKRATQGYGIRNVFLEQGFDGVIYDDAYFSYKRFNNSYVGMNENDLLWIKQSDALWVGTVFPFEKEKILRHVHFLERLTKVSSLSFMVSEGTPADKTLSEIMSPEKGFPVNIKDLSFKYPLNNLKFQFADLDVF